MPIRILPPEVAAKIAAGEVVERPASVVKELIENSLDAGATEIKIEVRGGGKRLIRVADNGCGIPANEVELAFARHATSKISGVDDLTRIRTLGFRGEALASVAAVAQVTVLTRAADETAGTLLRLADSRVTQRESRGAPVGTVVTVENLFATIPARRKFLRTDATERRHIDALVTRYAMAYPDRRFTLMHDSRPTFQTVGSSQLHDVLVKVYGLDTARQMIEISPPPGGDDKSAAEGIAVQGYAGAPSLHRASRDQITFFVNGRWVQDRMLTHALRQAYHTLLPVGRSPVAVIKVDLLPVLVDVNVHPAKSEVKFREPNTVFQAVQRAVRQALVDRAPVPQLGGWAAPGDGGGWERRQALMGAGAAQLAMEVQRTAPIAGAEGEPTLAFEPPRQLPPLRVLGQVAQMYIIAEGPEGLYLLDQHAAHERVLYERLSAQKTAAQVVSQTLLEPLTLELPPEQVTVMEANLSLLAQLGFQVEPFGGQTFLVRAVPAILVQSGRSDVDPRQALIGILEETPTGRQPLEREKEERIIASVCKQAAIKAGQTLSPEEMRELVRQLEATIMPRTCPHGRPTMIHLSRTQLEREFGRR